MLAFQWHVPDFGFSKSSIRAFLANPTKSGSGEISVRIFGFGQILADFSCTAAQLHSCGARGLLTAKSNETIDMFCHRLSDLTAGCALNRRGLD